MIGLKEDLVKKILKTVTPDNTHYSFLIIKGKIRKVGINNKKKTHTGCRKYYYEYPYIHSEFDLLRGVPKSAKGIVVNVRMGKSGQLLESEPCEGCQKLLSEYRGLQIMSLRQHIYYYRFNYGDGIVGLHIIHHTYPSIDIIKDAVIEFARNDPSSQTKLQLFYNYLNELKTLPKLGEEGIWNSKDNLLKIMMVKFFSPVHLALQDSI